MATDSFQIIKLLIINNAALCDFVMVYPFHIPYTRILRFTNKV